MIASAIPQHVRAACVCALACLFLLAASGTPWAQSDEKPTEADWSAIRAVIRAQIDAFREDQDELAFSYAAPGIREQFKTAENFMRMVKTGYPAVYRPASVAFVDASVEDGVPVQAVQFSDNAGMVWIGIYTMQRQPDKSWKVSGCVLVPGKATST
jgi:uncharacterized protein DUF4864